MLEAIINTELKKINTVVDVDGLCGGIVYDGNGTPKGKILFKKDGDLAWDVFNSDVYLIDQESEEYVGSVVSLAEPIKHFLKKEELNLAQLYLVYKMFLDNDKFIKRQLPYFQMREISVGYKGKSDIRPIKPLDDEDKVQSYYGLLKIINYRQEQKEKAKKYGRI